MSRADVFAPEQFPLTGMRLIEASAGTGKTYNIANLYLRLVVGLGDELDPQGWGEPLEVEKILVVTFTRAAAAELRGRIRALLELAWRDLRAGRSEHPFIASLVGQLAGLDAERNLAIQRLHTALAHMDEAGISTIHSFALRVSRELLFETGMLSDAEVVIGGNDKFERISADLRRELLLAGSALPGKAVDALKLGQATEFKGLFGSVDRHKEILPRLAAPAGPGIDSVVTAFNTLKEQLAQDSRKKFVTLRNEWLELLEARGEDQLSGAICELLDPIPIGGKEATVKSGPALVKRLSALYASDEVRTDELGGKSQPINRLRALRENPSAWASTPEQQALAGFLVAAFEFDQASPSAEEIDKLSLRAAVAHALQARLAATDLAELHLEELIELVLARLQPADSEAARALREGIQATYPVCLVDEFQDTDPAQFAMFQAIYGRPAQAGKLGFFMIGDPKQSIYAFRGADIFAYLNVRRQIAAQEAGQSRSLFTLNENFRSIAALVAASNALFAEPAGGAAGSFIYPGIEYRPVQSAADGPYDFDPGVLRSGGAELTPLLFIGNPDDPAGGGKVNKETLLRRYARDAAARISALLSGPGQAEIHKKGEARTLKPGDIAVLVRTGGEAQAMRAELARPGIGLRSVYLSQRDSVISASALAPDLYHVLAAINEPADRRRLKTALATPLMRGFEFDFSAVDSLEADDQALEALVGEFTACREAWLHKGILTALEQLLGNPARDLYGRIAQRTDSDRLLTDLRHLGDLLQQQDLDCDAPEQLIDWYAGQLDDDSALDEDTTRIRLESDEDLVKLVTIHVAKGLEYPVVFLPFFFLPWRVDLAKQLPLYHHQGDDGFRPVIDFAGPAGAVQQSMQREQLAEDMRLLYVAVTRAIYHCCIGISASTSGQAAVFQHTVWAHLLGLEAASPGWPEIRGALATRLGGDNPAVRYGVLGELRPVPFQPSGAAAEHPGPPLSEPRPVAAPRSSWQITSYSALARGKSVSLHGKDDDDEAQPAPELEEAERLARAGDDLRWQDDIRQAMPGGVLTGDALHDILEHHALAPAGDFDALVALQLQQRGLDKPYRPRDMGEAEYQRRSGRYLPSVVAWLQAALDQPLEVEEQARCPSLRQLFEAGAGRPELAFDFRLGGAADARFEAINRVLGEAGLQPLARHGDISGLMNGAIDLSFVHQGRVYICDYKSNKLGPAPRCYDQPTMTAKMREARYDLQYQIYTVATHRYLASRLGPRYAYDGGEVCFGGVFYLFLRGMGLQADPRYREHGLWFTRPEARQVAALDQAFGGARP